MTTLEIILIIVIAYFVIIEFFHFLNIATGCMLCDYQDLISDWFWIIMLPLALINRLVKTIFRD